MPRPSLLALCMLGITAPGAAAASCPPTFAQYPSAAWVGGHARPVLDTPAKRMFRTRIRDGARAGDRFADRSRLAVWGCGTGCQQGALIDTRSGQVRFTPDATLGYAVQPGSRLLIVSPLAPGDRPQDRHPGSFWPPPSFYVLTAGRLVQVCR